MVVAGFSAPPPATPGIVPLVLKTGHCLLNHGRRTSEVVAPSTRALVACRARPGLEAPAGVARPLDG